MFAGGVQDYLRVPPRASGTNCCPSDRDSASAGAGLDQGGADAVLRVRFKPTAHRVHDSALQAESQERPGHNPVPVRRPCPAG